jgi:hypothetical protein
MNHRRLFLGTGAGAGAALLAGLLTVLSLPSQAEPPLPAPPTPSATPAAPAANSPDKAGLAKVNAALAEFDACRALAMRALKQAQDGKTVGLYGRGWGVDMPGGAEGEAEDLLIEGLWLFDYLHAMDISSMSLISYAATSPSDHPNLQQELAAFTAYLPEAGAKTLAYYDKTAKALADGVARVNAAAGAKVPFKLQTVPALPKPQGSGFAGDGFTVGEAMVVVPVGRYAAQLDLYGHAPDWLLARSREAGFDFVRPWDVNVFEWPDVETEEGKYDWTKVDAVLAAVKGHGLGLWLRLPSSRTSPPDWLVKREGGAASLTGGDGKPILEDVASEDSFMFTVPEARPKKSPPNLFNPHVAEPFGKFVTALTGRVKESGVPVTMIELFGGGDRGGPLPYYAGAEAQGRFRAWLKKNNIDPRKRWGADYDADGAKLPEKFATVLPSGEDTPGHQRMLIDIARWREGEFIEYFRPQVAAIRSVLPDVSICATSSPQAEFNESMSGQDNERFVRELKLVPFGFSSENIWDDLRRSIAAPAHYSAANAHAGTGDGYAQYANSGYMHDSLCLWTLPHVRAFYWGDSIFYPDQRFVWTALLGLRRFHERAQGMAPEMLNTAAAPQVAMLLSDTSGKFQSFIPDWAGGTYGFRADVANYNKTDAIGWGRILDSLCMNHDVLSENQVREGKLSRYKLLVLPSAQALPADVAESIRKFVADGGIAIATSVPGLYDDDLNRKDAGQLADVFGADFNQFLGRTAIADSPMILSEGRAPWGEPWSPDAARAKTQTDTRRALYCSFKPRPRPREGGQEGEGGQVLEKFTNGEPAVILNSFGKGKAVVIGYPLGRESFLTDFYHEHYGNNWPDLPQGSRFQQGIFNWVEQLLPKLSFVRQAVVVEEIVGRSHQEDTSWPSRTFPRAMPGYRDNIWRTTASPRSVETIVRSAEGNPNLYLGLFNREGSYGFDPGVIDFEATSKEIAVLVDRPDLKCAYDINLACPVAVATVNSGARKVGLFRTMLEPSMSRMMVFSTDDTLRIYEGKRKRGGVSDEELRQSVAKVAGDAQPPSAPPPPQHILIAPADIRALLAERGRGAKGILISCENPADLPAARDLAAAIEKAYGKPARISRNSPRILGREFYLWNDGRANTSIDHPDIILGNRDSSGNVAKFAAYTGMNGHTAPLPFMTSQNFPGPGRSITVLTRPYTKTWSGAAGQDAAKTDELFALKPAPSVLVVGASDPEGLRGAVKELVELISSK